MPLILAWWDTSRQIKLLAARDTLFSSPRGRTPDRPLALARPRSRPIRHYEDQFWGAPARG